MALGTYVPLSDEIPALATAVPEDRFRHWSLFWTVAYTWVVCSRIGFDVPEEEREVVERLVLEDLTRSHPAARPLFDDLAKFFADRSDLIANDASEGRLTLKAILGLWLAWNLTGKAKLPDERRIISQLGHLCYEPCAGYWLAPSA